MEFHIPSFLLGIATAMGVRSARKRLRPVVVEVASLGVYLARVGEALVERRREALEDLLAEIDERVRERARGRSAKPSPARPSVRVAAVDGRGERPS